MAVVMTRGEVHLVRLDPTLGSEIQKTQPCVIVSPDELNPTSPDQLRQRSKVRLRPRSGTV
jgi:mRNA-degrading endonuclease toxin of MazEF toxin-antitoxin module